MKPIKSTSSKKHKDTNLCKQVTNEILLSISSRLVNKYRKHISSNIQKFINHNRNKLNQALALNSNNKSSSKSSSKSSNKSNSKKITHIFTNARINRVSYLALAPTPQTSNDLLLAKYNDESRKFIIPPFIEIFKFLFNHSSISKYFTPQELQDASRILSLQSTHEIYSNLHSNPIGNKLADVYANQHNQINLTNQFPTTDFHSLLFNSFTSY
jgi:hypothetical protein